MQIVFQKNLDCPTPKLPHVKCIDDELADPLSNFTPHDEKRIFILESSDFELSSFCLFFLIRCNLFALSRDSLINFCLE